MPSDHDKDETEMTEKLLEMIYTTSKHFSENATLEYNKVAGQRAFEHVPPHALAGQRNFRACEQHYSTLWSQAFRSKLPGFAHMPPTKRPAEPARNTLESGMAARDAREEANLLDSGAGVGFASPLRVTPAESLAELARLGCWPNFSGPGICLR